MAILISKFEQEQAAKAERKKRQQNIDYLREQIQDDEKVLQVIPCDHSNLDSMRDRRVMAAHIAKLREQLADEVRLYNKTYEAGDADEVAISLR